MGCLPTLFSTARVPFAPRKTPPSPLPHCTAPPTTDACQHTQPCSRLRAPHRCHSFHSFPCVHAKAGAGDTPWARTQPTSPPTRVLAEGRQGTPRSAVGLLGDHPPAPTCPNHHAHTANTLLHHVGQCTCPCEGPTYRIGGYTNTSPPPGPNVHSEHTVCVHLGGEHHRPPHHPNFTARKRNTYRCLQGRQRAGFCHNNTAHTATLAARCIGTCLAMRSPARPHKKWMHRPCRPPAGAPLHTKHQEHIITVRCEVVACPDSHMCACGTTTSKRPLHGLFPSTRPPYTPLPVAHPPARHPAPLHRETQDY